MKVLKKIINRFLMRYGSVRRISVSPDSKEVFLTFDDGPSPGITEFVLDQLEKYNYKATFFCTGKNAETYPELLEAIKQRGHCIGNHTYEHIKAYDRSDSSYVKDVYKADKILNSAYFRPPNGCMTLSTWFKLYKYKIVYWTIGSNDWCETDDLFEIGLEGLKKTTSGDIILFHFSNDLEKGTRSVLPRYLDWLKENGFVSKSLDSAVGI